MILSTRRLTPAAIAALMTLVLCSFSTITAFSTVSRPATTLSTRLLTKPSIHATSVESISSSSTSLLKKKHHRQHDPSSSQLKASSTPNDNDDSDDPMFDPRTTISLIGGQSLLIVAAIIAASLLKIPNFGFGPSINFSPTTIQQGLYCALPLFVLAYALDNIEDQYPALQDVTKATQRSVLALLGSTLKPALALVVSCALGLVAGFGEEMLFRGVLQYEIAGKFGAAIGITVSSLIFGLLHAVTPLYAILATLASVFFGWLYAWSGNLAVPIVCHAIYDVGALLWAHWTVAKMSPQERQAIADWKGPSSSKR